MRVAKPEEEELEFAEVLLVNSYDHVYGISSTRKLFNRARVDLDWATDEIQDGFTLLMCVHQYKLEVEDREAQSAARRRFHGG